MLEHYIELAVRNSTRLTQSDPYKVAPGEPISIGREYSHTIRLDDPAVSGFHGAIIYEDEVMKYSDLSRHGTRYNREKTVHKEKIALKRGDILSVGSSSIIVIDIFDREGSR
jgi:pSer/pThr/pTyr-binding forkhead associated (FHA) protein